MKKILFNFIFLLAVNSNAQSVKRIPGCIFKKNKVTNEFAIPKTRSVSYMPSAFSLKEYYPVVGDQGMYGTCTAWASTYASFTALTNIKNNRLGNTLKEEDCFSPQLTYDLIREVSDTSCESGSKIFKALDLLKRVGAVKLSEYPYNCNILNQGNGIERLKVESFDTIFYKEILSSASKNRLDDFIELGKNNVIDKIKYAIKSKFPVIIGITDYKDIETNLGKDIWIPEVINFTLSGHAMSIISYDDNKNGGSFELMNSWGNKWGNSGYCWVRYADLEKLIVQAFAITNIKPINEKIEFYDFNLNIKLIGQDNKPFEFENENIEYDGDEFYIGSIDNSEYNFLYPSDIEKFQIALGSNNNLYFYLLSRGENSNVNLDYPISSSDDNFLNEQNSGIIIPKEARNYYTINNFEVNWFFENSQFLILFSKKPLDIKTIINKHKNEKFNNLNSFVKNVFQDNIVLSDLTIGNNEDWFSNDNYKMNINLSNDINYILPIIVNLKKKPIPKKLNRPNRPKVKKKSK